MGSPDRMNILLMTADDVGRFVGCYGVETVSTPALDGLAAEGVRFDSAFCTAPLCSPSRASLFTGRYPHSTGVMGLTQGDFGWDMHPTERHLASLLSEAGYRTELIGKHHESRVRPDHEIAERLGFDRVAARIEPQSVADRTIDALRGHADRQEPFYLQVGFREPHRRGHPAEENSTHVGFLGDYIQPDREFGVTVPGYLHDDELAREDLAELQGAVRQLDGSAGRILTELDRLGLTEQTIVVFTTDHGVGLPRAKFTLYDPGLETALIIRAPRQGWIGGRVVEGLVSNIDVVPTLLEAVGVPVPESVHGRSLTSALAGDEDTARDYVFGENTYHVYYDPRRCVRTMSHKLIVNFSHTLAFYEGSQSWRPRTVPRVPLSIGQFKTAPVELYDLRVDPLELTNLADDPDQREHLDHLRAVLLDWMRTTDDPLLTGAVTAPSHQAALEVLHHQPNQPDNATTPPL